MLQSAVLILFHNSISSFLRIRIAGIRGIQGVVRKTVNDELRATIWEPQHMDKIVPSLLFNMQKIEDVDRYFYSWSLLRFSCYNTDFFLTGENQFIRLRVLETGQLYLPAANIFVFPTTCISLVHCSRSCVSVFTP